jgi:hypothetical protein
MKEKSDADKKASEELKNKDLRPESAEPDELSEADLEQVSGGGDGGTTWTGT